MQQMQTVEQSMYSPPSAAFLIPRRLGSVFHIHRQDFEDAFGHVEADILRAAEWLTGTRVSMLREIYEIPANYLPAEADLWLDEDEMSSRRLKYLTANSNSHATYAKYLREEDEEDEEPELIALGSLRVRYIARPYIGYSADDPGVAVYEEVRRDEYKRPFTLAFFVVDDRAGNYTDFHGGRRNAKDLGYQVRKQYLCDIDKATTLIRALDGLDPPPKLARWKPVTIRRKGSTASVQVSANSTTSSASDDPINNAQQASAILAAQGIGVLATNNAGKAASDNGAATLSRQNNTMQHAAASIENSSQFPKVPRLLADSESVKVAPWSPQAIIDLVSMILAVPDSANCDEEEWRRDWLEPAQWLLEITDDGNDPIYAWPKIARHIYGMLIGPTWHVKKAARPFTAETLTLRHVVGWNKATSRLDGHNWRAVGSQLDKENWYPDEIPQYVGPPLFAPEHDSDASAGYAAGYGGVEASAPTTSDEGVTQASLAALEVTAGDALDVPAPDRGDELAADDVPTIPTEPEIPRTAMSVAEAEALTRAIQVRYPSVTPDLEIFGSDDVALRFQCGPEDWETLTLMRSETWYHAAPVIVRMIEKAAKFAAIRGTASQTDDERGPPGLSSSGEVIRDAHGEAML